MPNVRPRRALAALFGLALTLLPAPAVAEEILRLGACETVPPDALVDALQIRLGGAVEHQPDAEPSDGVWVLAITADGSDARMSLLAPDGRVWNRPVPLDPRESETDRVRAMALQADDVAALAGAPFASGGPSPDAPPGAPPRGLAVQFDLGFLGQGALWSSAEGARTGIGLLGRPNLEWPWGLWIEAESGWYRILNSSVPEVSLDTVPIRLGIGASIPLNSWKIRFALQAVVEYWRVSGEADHPSGWRAGAGLLATAGYNLVPWCAAGLDAGLEFLPRAVQIDYAHEPLLALGQLRWRAGVWVGFTFAEL